MPRNGGDKARTQKKKACSYGSSKKKGEKGDKKEKKRLHSLRGRKQGPSEGERTSSLFPSRKKGGGKEERKEGAERGTVLLPSGLPPGGREGEKEAG